MQNNADHTLSEMVVGWRIVQMVGEVEIINYANQMSKWLVTRREFDQTQILEVVGAVCPTEQFTDLKEINKKSSS